MYSKLLATVQQQHSDINVYSHLRYRVRLARCLSGACVLLLYCNELVYLSLRDRDKPESELPAGSALHKCPSLQLQTQKAEQGRARQPCWSLVTLPSAGRKHASSTPTPINRSTTGKLWVTPPQPCRSSAMPEKIPLWIRSRSRRANIHLCSSTWREQQAFSSRDQSPSPISSSSRYRQVQSMCAKRRRPSRLCATRNVLFSDPMRPDAFRIKC